MMRFAPVAMLVAMVVVRTAALLVLMKFLAVQFGTDGFGQLSQILAVGALFSVLAGGGLTNGIVRNLAASNSPSDHLGWIKAALPIAGASAVLLALVAWFVYRDSWRHAISRPGPRLRSADHRSVPGRRWIRQRRSGVSERHS